MKKAIWIFIILFACSFPKIEAQEHYAANFSVGVKAGASLSRAMFSPGVKQGFLPGTTGGLMFRYIEENHFGLIAEINYVDRGWKESFDELPFAFSRRLSYLQIPLLAHIYFGSDRAKFFFNAGPEIGFLLKEKTDANFDIANPGAVENFPTANRNTEQYAMPIKNKIDYGISAGIGAEVNLNPKNSLLLEGRFYYGLNNIFGANKKDVFAASNGISILVTLGYMFRIK